jgi:hypothetical protein
MVRSVGPLRSRDAGREQSIRLRWPGGCRDRLRFLWCSLPDGFRQFGFDRLRRGQRFPRDRGRWFGVGGPTRHGGGLVPHEQTVDPRVDQVDVFLPLRFGRGWRLRRGVGRLDTRPIDFDGGGTPRDWPALRLLGRGGCCMGVGGERIDHALRQHVNGNTVVVLRASRRRGSLGRGWLRGSFRASVGWLGRGSAFDRRVRHVHRQALDEVIDVLGHLGQGLLQRLRRCRRALGVPAGLPPVFGIGHVGRTPPPRPSPWSERTAVEHRSRAFREARRRRRRGNARPRSLFFVVPRPSRRQPPTVVTRRTSAESGRGASRERLCGGP